MVNKVTVPSGSSQSFPFVSSYGPGSFSLSDGGSNNSGPLDAGTYSVLEMPGAGWIRSSSCSDGSLISAIVLDAGETVTCTFTNAMQASISVGKVTVPGGSPDGFDFQLRRLGDSSLVDSITGLRDADAPATFVTVAPGTYKVEESLPTSWKLTSSVCDNTDTAAGESVDGGNLTVVAGDHWLCTFTNTKQGSIVVKKVTVPASVVSVVLVRE